MLIAAGQTPVTCLVCRPVFRRARRAGTNVHSRSRRRRAGMVGNSIVLFLKLAGTRPLLQALAIILGTFILEDAATVLAAMRAEEGAIPIWLALVSLYVGVVLGDLGLYALGRLSARIGWIARLAPPDRSRDAGDVAARAGVQGGAGQPLPAGDAAARPTPPAASCGPICGSSPWPRSSPPLPGPRLLFCVSLRVGRLPDRPFRRLALGGRRRVRARPDPRRPLRRPVAERSADEVRNRPAAPSCRRACGSGRSRSSSSGRAGCSTRRSSRSGSRWGCATAT